MKLLKKIKVLNPFTNVKKRAELLSDDLGNIGKNVEIFHKVSFGSEPYLVYLGDNVKVTYGCQFITHDGGTYVLRNLNEKYKKMVIYGEIKVGNNVFIGNNSMILPGVTIGNNVIIGAGSVVTKSIEDNKIAAGNPCKVVSDIESYILKYDKFSIETIGLSSKEKFELIKEKKELFIKK
ncbi:DapH/DapD/GlmU-related protein [Streptococcus uberis]|uniref:DapH/DapD/GlmU-related protein n=1 Tax=Streptococcus uberis TaxID=1349 RepID=UPI003891CF65